jgi:hypothetical protein
VLGIRHSWLICNPLRWRHDQWFAKVMPGKDPQATLDGWDGDGWNGWHGAPYVYPEFYHPTAWVGREAVQFIHAQAKADKPFMAKVSFHRPHSPYDPPQRVLSKFDAVSPLAFFLLTPAVLPSQGGVMEEYT